MNLVADYANYQNTRRLRKPKMPSKLMNKLARFLQTISQDPAHQGGIIVKPVADADKVTVKYLDEDGNEHTITASKDPASGAWSGTGLPTGVSVDPATGTVTLTPGAVQDGSTAVDRKSVV